MSLYHYRACNAAGETITGSLEADSLASLEHLVRRSGSWLLDARVRTGSAGTSRGARASASRAELVEFFVQMSLLLRARINLPASLERVAEDFKEEGLGAVVRELHEKVTTGMPMHQAMAAQPRVFPTQVVAIVQAGEISGRLPEVFESLTAYYQWLDQMVGEIRQALIYPVIVTGATLSLIVGLFTFIVPRFVELLNGLSVSVPLATRIVMSISGFLTADWPVLLGLAVGVPLAVRGALRAKPFARAWDRALMRVPVFGPLVAMFALSRFAHNLGMLYKAGIPLVRGLEICRHLAGNHAIAQALDEVRQGVLEGVPLSRCLRRYDFFPATLVTMISTGETTGSLDSALESVSEYYNKIIPRRIKAIFSLFDPIVLLSLIGVVGFVALAVVLPILQLWQIR
jgi:type IV pilus assembly protein PilC